MQLVVVGPTTITICEQEKHTCLFSVAHPFVHNPRSYILGTDEEKQRRHSDLLSCILGTGPQTGLGQDGVGGGAMVLVTGD